jgi:energy-coupling factor transporter ATP-binding protein EcfA2
MVHRQECTAPGYFVELYIREKTMESNESKDTCPDYARTKALPVNFNWSSIPMLTVVTGVNGVGKTALLQSILLAHPQSGGQVATDRNISIKITDNESIVDDVHLVGILLDAMIDEIEKADEISISNSLIDSMQVEVREKVERNLAEKHPVIYYATIPDERPDPEMWYCLPENREDNLIHYIRNRGRIGQRQNNRYEHLINYLDNVKKNQPEDEPMKKFYEFSVFYSNRCVFYPIRCMRSANIILYLLSTTTTKDELNEFLMKNNCKYIIDSVNHGAKIYNFDVLVTNRFDKRATNLHLLSPGEEFHLLSLLLQYDYGVSSSTEINSPAILLLDEPDAHLHPSCIKDFMQCIVKLVAVRKLQIIMITHKATTVRYVPFDECLFIMNRDAQTDCVNISRAMNKNQAVQLLTSNVVQINENFRLIFVEAFGDKGFYTTVLNHLNKNKCLRGIHPLLFECYGNLVKPNDNNQQSNKISNLPVVDTADRKHVIDLVKELVNSDSDDDLSLQNFIYGLVDGDNLEGNEHLEKYNIITLDRYSIENYIFDPIHVFFYLVNELKKSKDHKSNKTLKTIQDVKSQLNIVYSDTVISDTLKQTNALSTLQKITDCISNLFTNALHDILENSKTGEYKSVIESLRATRNDTNSNLTTNNTHQERKDVTLVDEHDKLINNGTSNVTIVNNIDLPIILQYPKLLLKMQGHSTEKVYGKVYSSLRMGNMLKFIEKQMIIPGDLLKAFKKLSNAELTESVTVSTNTLQTTTTTANISLNYAVGYQVTATSTTTLSPYTSSALGKTGTQTKYSSIQPVHSSNTKVKIT